MQPYERAAPGGKSRNRVRCEPGAVRPRPRDTSGRSGDPARAQRHGKNDDGALDHGPHPGEERSHPFPRRAHRAAAPRPHRAPRHRAGSRGTPDIPQPERAGEPGGVRRKPQRDARPVDARQGAGVLSPACRAHGQPRRPALGRRAADARHRPALMTNPYLLILDEATEGLAPLVREEIWRCLAALKAAGQTILVIDKYVERLIAIADHHTVIERGRVAWRGTSAALAADQSLWHRYLGV